MDNLIVINEMKRFHDEVTVSNKKDVRTVVLDIGMYFAEILLTILPIILLWIISTLVVNSDFNIELFFRDGQLLWFSITTITFLIAKTLWYRKRKTFIDYIILFISLILLIVYTSTYVFLNLTETIKGFNVELNIKNIMLLTVAFSVFTVVWNVISIIHSRGTGR